MPKGYIILTEDVKDPAGFAEYGKLAGKAMGGATIVAVDHKPQVIEGEWHNSDAYQEAAKLRQAAADCNGVIVAGL